MQGRDAGIDQALALAAVGVTQFNIYLMCGDEEQSLGQWAKDVLPGARM